MFSCVIPQSLPPFLLVRRLVCEGYRCIICRLGFMTQFSMALDEAFKRIRKKSVLKWFGNRIHCQSHAFIIFKKGNTSVLCSLLIEGSI